MLVVRADYMDLLVLLYPEGGGTLLHQSVVLISFDLVLIIYMLPGHSWNTLPSAALNNKQTSIYILENNYLFCK